MRGLDPDLSQHIMLDPDTMFVTPVSAGQISPVPYISIQRWFLLILQRYINKGDGWFSSGRRVLKLVVRLLAAGSSLGSNPDISLASLASQ